MVKNAPEGNQLIIPYLAYDNAGEAIQFLCRAFGFECRFQFPMEDGRVGHAELALHGETLMLASSQPALKFLGPRSLPGLNAHVAVYVDDVDAHFARAKMEGAEVLSEPETQFYGDRTYRVRDCEGHQWTFATHVKDISPEEMGSGTCG